jgi:hypothetical protein
LRIKYKILCFLKRSSLGILCIVLPVTISFFFSFSLCFSYSKFRRHTLMPMSTFFHEHVRNVAHAEFGGCEAWRWRSKNYLTKEEILILYHTINFFDKDFNNQHANRVQAYTSEVISIRWLISSDGTFILWSSLDVWLDWVKILAQMQSRTATQF